MNRNNIYTSLDAIRLTSFKTPKSKFLQPLNLKHGY